MAGLSVDSLMTGVCSYFRARGYSEFSVSQIVRTGARDLNFGCINGVRLTGQGADTVFSEDCSSYVQHTAALTVVCKDGRRDCREIADAPCLEKVLGAWFPARGEKTVTAGALINILERVLAIVGDLQKKI
jgi:hypothetical protein